MQILNKYTPEEFAAMWGCDPAYDKAPRNPGDGYLFYNFGSKLQQRDHIWLLGFAGAILRTMKGVVAAPHLHESEDLQGLLELMEYVTNMIAEEVDNL
jgi:hypothetical protein